MLKVAFNILDLGEPVFSSQILRGKQEKHLKVLPVTLLVLVVSDILHGTNITYGSNELSNDSTMSCILHLHQSV